MPTPPTDRPFSARPAITSREANVAMYRLVDGKGSPYRALGALLGMSANAVKLRVCLARNSYPREELEPEAADFDPGDRVYLRKLADRVGTDEAREWVNQNVAPHRARPDKRCMSRDHA